MFDRALRALALLGGVVLLGMMGLILFDIIMRYALKIPFLGAYEMTELAMVLIVFFGLAHCGATGGHVAVDILEPLLERPGLRWLSALVPFAGAAVVGLIAWHAVAFAIGSRKRGEATNMMGIETWPYELVTALGMGLFAVVLIIQAWKTLRPAESKGQK